MAVVKFKEIVINFFTDNYFLFLKLTFLQFCIKKHLTNFLILNRWTIQYMHYVQKTPFSFDEKYWRFEWNKFKKRIQLQNFRHKCSRWEERFLRVIFYCFSWFIQWGLIAKLIKKINFALWKWIVVQLDKQNNYFVINLGFYLWGIIKYKEAYESWILKQ